MNSTFIKKIITKKGKEAVIRYPTIDDVIDMTTYINTLSREDTFITFSGEQITLDSEREYITDLLKRMVKGDAANLICLIDGKIVGIAGVERKISSRNRGMHIGIFGISVGKEYRGDGIGQELSAAVIDEAKKNMAGLRLITLSVYKPNTVAYDLYRKLGFVDYGTLPQGILFHGEYIDEIEMYLKLV